MLQKEKRRPLFVSRANSIFDCLASRHSRLRQDSKIDYSSITLRLASSSVPSSRIQHTSIFLFFLSLSLLLSLAFCFSFLSLLAPIQLPHLSLALSTPHSVGTHRTWGPHPFPTFFGARLLLPFAPPLSRPDLGVSWLHVACPNDVSERTGTTAI